MKKKKANLAKIAELITEAGINYEQAKMIALQLKAGTRIILSRKDIMFETLVVSVVHDEWGTRVALLGPNLNLLNRVGVQQELIDPISFLRDLEIEGFKATIFIPREELFFKHVL